MQSKQLRWTLVLILALALVVEGSILGFGTKKSDKAPVKVEGPENKAPLNKKLSNDYINGVLSIQGQMLFNAVNKPSSLKLYRSARYMQSPQDYPDLLGLQ